ncbi:MAG: NADPH-dependent FMN reductase [Bacteroidota bacterium]
MITVIIGSNRPNSHTAIFARHAYHLLAASQTETVALLDIKEVADKIVQSDMYQKDGQSAEVSQIQDQFFIPSHKFWFFVPEYNGSIPGILKLLLDAISVRDYQPTFSHKKACITGVATGRAGNLRGMDHLADILNHLNVAVLPQKQPISSSYKLIDETSQLVDEKTKQLLAQQKEAFLAF